MIVKSRFDSEFNNHHKTELLDDKRRKIYDQSFKPAQNPKVNNHQSVHETMDPKDYMHPDRVGYQLLPNNVDNRTNKFKNVEADQIVLGIQNSASNSVSPERTATQ